MESMHSLEFEKEVLKMRNDITKIEEKLNNIIDKEKKFILYAHLDMVEIAKIFGFTVCMGDDDTYRSFVLLNIKPKETIKTIFINNNINPQEARYLVAYELAHWILEYDDSKTKYLHSTYLIQSKTSKNQKNIDADYFACCLLIPREMLETDFEDLIKDMEVFDSVALLAKKYKVSETLLYKRLLQVGILTLNK